MKLLSSAAVGDRFRAAHPNQVSLNGIKMDRAEVYYIERAYGAAPFIRICRLAEGPDSRLRSLMPDVPILSEKEPAPPVEAVEKFLLGSSPRTRVVLYELSWDGTTQVHHRLQPQELTVFTRLWLTGRRKFTVDEMRESLSKIKLEGKVTAERAFAFYSKHWVELGLLREVREQKNSASRKLHEIIGT